MPKLPKKSPPALSDRVTPDLHQKWLAWLKGNSITAAVILAVPAIIIALALANGLTTIPSIWNRLWPNPVASFSTGLYIFEVANNRSDGGRILFEEVRDLSSGCRIMRMETAPNEQGIWASPGPGGARATLMFKVYVKNSSSEKLTNIRLLLSPASLPFDFSTISGTPNISTRMSRPPLGQGGPSPYIIEIDNLAVDDFGVITLSSTLTRDNARNIAGTTFRMAIVSMRADQIPTAAPKFAMEKLSAKDLYFEEGIKTTGNPGVSIESNIELVASTKHPRAEDFSFLSPPKPCNE